MGEWGNERYDFMKSIQSKIHDSPLICGRSAFHMRDPDITLWKKARATRYHGMPELECLRELPGNNLKMNPDEKSFRRLRAG